MQGKYGDMSYGYENKIWLRDQPSSYSAVYFLNRPMAVQRKKLAAI